MMCADPAPETTHSGGSADFGALVDPQIGTGSAFGFAAPPRPPRFSWISSISGGTDGPRTSSIALCTQISSLHTGGFGRKPPAPTYPIVWLLMMIGSPPATG